MLRDSSPLWSGQQVVSIEIGVLLERWLNEKNRCLFAHSKSNLTAKTQLTKNFLSRNPALFFRTLLRGLRQRQAFVRIIREFKLSYAPVAYTHHICVPLPCPSFGVMFLSNN